MKYELFSEVVLLKDIPEEKLKTGEIATVVENHPSESSEDGYTLEVFNAVVDTNAVITVTVSDIESLKESEVLRIRSMGAV
ncbi:DUF4926 domain-containing protein [Rhodohalobacter sp. 8-1]|uniref:DUF4926 domain-containing protein n=1 Tax=Rhodohalobacter sp. 8-1 TaxID=3131972 RepID=UPI0030EBC50E